jgi:hypothetical protein
MKGLYFITAAAISVVADKSVKKKLKKRRIIKALCQIGIETGEGH